MNCNGCGKEITDPNQEFCDNCGTKISKESPQQESVAVEQPTPPPVQQTDKAVVKQKNTMQIVLSIINILLCFPVIFGIIGLILALTAKNAPTNEAQAKKLKASKILGILGIILTLLIGLIFVVITALSLL